MRAKRAWCTLCRENFEDGDDFVKCKNCKKRSHKECLVAENLLDLSQINDISNYLCYQCVNEDNDEQENEDRCKICREKQSDSALLLCDSCPNSYHVSCLGLQVEPATDKWFCPECKPEEHNNLDVRRMRKGFVVDNVNGENVNSSTCYVCQRQGKLLGCDFCPNSFHPTCLPDLDFDNIGDQWECPCCKNEDPLLNQGHKRWTKNEIHENMKKRQKELSYWRSRIIKYRNRFLLAHRKDLQPFVNPRVLANLTKIFKSDFYNAKNNIGKKKGQVNLNNYQNDYDKQGTKKDLEIIESKEFDDFINSLEDEANENANQFIESVFLSVYYPNGRKIERRPLVDNVQLKPHQEDGVEWLLKSFLTGGAILADEMGLGKTIQTLCFLSYLKCNKIDGPHLIVVPLSTVGNWLREIHRFTPHLTCIKICGSKNERTHAKEDRLAEKGLYDLYVTTYETVKNEEEFFVETIPKWQCIVLDEAHRIKNQSGAIRHSMDRVVGNMRLLLTGTPLQNNSAELFTLINFMFPDIFKNSEIIEQAFMNAPCGNATASVNSPKGGTKGKNAGRNSGTNVNGKDDKNNQLTNNTTKSTVDIANIDLKSTIKEEDLKSIRCLLDKIMLRRLKEQAIKLPKKIFHEVWLPLGSLSAKWYKRLLEIRSMVEEKVSVKKLLGLVIKMRIICGHPKGIVSRPSQMEKLFAFFEEESEELKEQVKNDAMILKNISGKEHIEASSKLLFLDKLLCQLHYENCKYVKNYAKSFELHKKEIAAHKYHKIQEQRNAQKKKKEAVGKFKKIEALENCPLFTEIYNEGNFELKATSKKEDLLKKFMYTVPVDKECPYKKKRCIYDKVQELFKHSNGKKKDFFNSENDMEDDRYSSSNNVATHGINENESDAARSVTYMEEDELLDINESDGKLAINAKKKGKAGNSSDEEYQEDTMYSDKNKKKRNKSSSEKTESKCSIKKRKTQRQNDGNKWNDEGENTEEGEENDEDGESECEEKEEDDEYGDNKDGDEDEEYGSEDEEEHVENEREGEIRGNKRKKKEKQMKMKKRKTQDSDNDVNNGDITDNAKDSTRIAKNMVKSEGGSTVNEENNESRVKVKTEEPLTIENEETMKGNIENKNVKTDVKTENCVKGKENEDGNRKNEIRMHKVLIFTQFQLVLDELEEYCKYRCWKYMRLDGSTNKLIRELDIREFNLSNSIYFIYLISTRAGGLGINLTAANHVIMYDEDWNPFIDLQAIDRAHRIGQRREVNVWKLMTEWTVEERMAFRREQKLKLDKLVVQTQDDDDEDILEGFEEKLSSDEIRKLMLHGKTAIQNMNIVDNTDMSLECLIERGRQKLPIINGVDLEKQEKSAIEEELNKTTTEEELSSTLEKKERKELRNLQLENTLNEEYDENAIDIDEVMMDEAEEPELRHKQSQLAECSPSYNEGSETMDFTTITSKSKSTILSKSNTSCSSIIGNNNNNIGASSTAIGGGGAVNEGTYLWRSGRERKKPQNMYTPEYWGKKQEVKQIKHELRCFICNNTKNYKTVVKDRNGNDIEIDYGDMINCFRCPKVYHKLCEGIKEENIKKTWTCSWHECCLCFRKSSQCGNLLIHCATCPTSFCYNCFPPDYTRYYVGEEYYHNLRQRGVNFTAQNWVCFLCSKCKAVEEQKRRRKMTKEERENEKQLQKELRSQLQDSKQEEIEVKKRKKMQQNERDKYIVENRKRIDALDLNLETKLREAYENLFPEKFVKELTSRIEHAKLLKQKGNEEDIKDKEKDKDKEKEKEKEKEKDKDKETEKGKDIEKEKDKDKDKDKETEKGKETETEKDTEKELEKEKEKDKETIGKKKVTTFLHTKLPNKLLALCENCKLPCHANYKYPGNCCFPMELDKSYFYAHSTFSQGSKEKDSLEKKGVKLEGAGIGTEGNDGTVGTTLKDASEATGGEKEREFDIIKLEEKNGADTETIGTLNNSLGANNKKNGDNNTGSEEHSEKKKMDETLVETTEEKGEEEIKKESNILKKEHVKEEHVKEEHLIKKEETAVINGEVKVELNAGEESRINVAAHHQSGEITENNTPSASAHMDGISPNSKNKTRRFLRAVCSKCGTVQLGKLAHFRKHCDKLTDEEKKEYDERREKIGKLIDLINSKNMKDSYTDEDYSSMSVFKFKGLYTIFQEKADNILEECIREMNWDMLIANKKKVIKKEKEKEKEREKEKEKEKEKESKKGTGVKNEENASISNSRNKNNNNGNNNTNNVATNDGTNNNNSNNNVLTNNVAIGSSDCSDVKEGAENKNDEGEGVGVEKEKKDGGNEGANGTVKRKRSTRTSKNSKRKKKIDEYTNNVTQTEDGAIPSEIFSGEKTEINPFHEQLKKDSMNANFMKESVTDNFLQHARHFVFINKNNVENFTSEGMENNHNNVNGNKDDVDVKNKENGVRQMDMLKNIIDNSGEKELIQSNQVHNLNSMDNEGGDGGGGGGGGLESGELIPSLLHQVERKRCELIDLTDDDSKPVVRTIDVVGDEKEHFTNVSVGFNNINVHTNLLLGSKHMGVEDEYVIKDGEQNEYRIETITNNFVHSDSGKVQEFILYKKPKKEDEIDDNIVVMENQTYDVDIGNIKHSCGNETMPIVIEDDSRSNTTHHNEHSDINDHNIPHNIVTNNIVTNNIVTSINNINSSNEIITNDKYTNGKINNEIINKNDDVPA